MSYKPIKYMPRITNPYLHLHPAPEPEPSGAWTTIALKLCGVVAGLTSAGMLYLVFACGTGRW